MVKEASGPQYKKILVVESADRAAITHLLPTLYGKQPSRLDILTCYSGAVAQFDESRGTIMSIHDPQVRSSKQSFLRELSDGRYDTVVILCTGSRVMSRWKWVLAARFRAALVIANSKGRVVAWRSNDLRLWSAYWFGGENPWEQISFKALLFRRPAEYRRVLFLESGPREFTERVLPLLYDQNPGQLDILTSYDSAPSAFDPGIGSVLYVNSQEVRNDRPKFIASLRGDDYDTAAVVCVGSPLMSRWKWAVALQISAGVIKIDRDSRLVALRLSEPAEWAEFFLGYNPFRRLGDTAAAILRAPVSVLYLTITTLAIHTARWFRKPRRLQS